MLEVITLTILLMHLQGSIVAWILYKRSFQELKTKMVIEPQTDWLYIALLSWVSVLKLLKILK